jgi:cation-transporting ATPase 13A1
VDECKPFVAGDTYETLVLLSILLVFALAASSHVFVKGMKDGKRSQYELVLRCILIVTSVAGAYTRPLFGSA